MRVIRSEDEKVIAAQSNNSRYNRNGTDGHFEYEFCTEYSFSDKKFMNELARDRVYGTANMRPVNRNKSMVKERLYQKAIEESSRMKTGGYYNELGSLQNEYCIHDTIPGRLKDKINEEKVCQINDAIASNMMKQETEMKNEFNNLSQDNLIQFEVKESQESPYRKKPRKDMYEDIMDRVNNDIINNSNQNGSNTKIVESGRQELRQEVAVQVNNIPYKKTEIFEKGSKKGKKQENGLVVRDCKSEKHCKSKKRGKSKSTGRKIAVGAWLLSAMLMIASIAVTYLYMTGEISIELIKSYISRI